MAIAYPLSNRFRTGMTIAIFAVVMFSVIFMATLFKVNEIVLTDTGAIATLSSGWYRVGEED